MKLKLTTLIACLLVIALITAPVRADEESAPEPPAIDIGQWLVAGPVPVPVPVFDTADAAGRHKAILDTEHLVRTAWPAAGDRADWFLSAGLEWAETGVGEGGVLALAGGEDRALPLVAFVAAYVTSTHYQEVALTVKGTCPFVLFVDGDEKARSGSSAEDGGNPPAEDGGNPVEKSANVALIRGKHAVLLKTLCPAGDAATAWTVSASVTPAKDEPPSLTLSTAPDRTFADMERSKEFSSVGPFALSPDGKVLAVVVRSKDRLTGKSTSLFELREMPSNRILDRLDGSAGMVALQWSPDGKHLSFKRSGRLMRYTLPTRRTTAIIEGVKGVGKYVWTPDSSHIVYAVSESKSSDKDSHYKLRGLYDRLTDYSETKSLYITPADGGARHRLTTTGEFAMEDFALSPDGTKIAFVKRYPVVDRPYFKTEFWILSLERSESEKLLETAFPFENVPSNLTWSPDGKRIAFIAPPDQIGAAARTETEHNFFENDLWMIDIASRGLSRISDRFDAAVNAPLFWHPDNGRIYFNAHDRTRKNLACIAVDGDSDLEKLHETPTVVSTYSTAANGSGVAFTGSSVERPVSLYYRKLGAKKVRKLIDPNAEYMARMKLGKWERYDFTNKRGQKIDGFLFYPPDFEEGKKYPLIVYYYGGATPQMERFSVTYYHFMPANGYMMYVPNPIGACGYGEEFSNGHVNDQGWLAGEDILEGLEKLLADKAGCIDAGNIGAYGGSYGGFMTLSLITRTDRFKASCSMYGISNIASYWGAGIWGYTYGDTAMALSYPWNRRDIFVDRAPLFNADKVQSALLLLHGTDDVNVPVVESEQMFTALKVLGKDVAYVRFPGEDHGIASTTDKYILHRRMILEWFDKYLKNQPDAWNERFPE